MLDEREDLERLMARVEQAREAQVTYSMHKNPTNEKKMVSAVRDLDTVMKTLLKKGYNPDQHKKTAGSNKLF